MEIKILLLKWDSILEVEVFLNRMVSNSGDLFLVQGDGFVPCAKIGTLIIWKNMNGNLRCGESFIASSFGSVIIF